MQKVIVTGANGFIGSHLVKELNKRGVKVIALVDSRYDYSSIDGLADITIIYFSLQELDELYTDKRLCGSELIYHMAWTGVSASCRNSEDEQLQNIKYSIDVLKLAVHFQIPKVLIPGSAAEVSCGEGIITGQEIPAPSDIYSATKVATRYICQVFARQHQVELIWPLITSIYGPGRDTGDLISYTIKSLLKGVKPSFTKLEQQWDYLYIDDLIEALIVLGIKGKGGNVYPIGSGENMQMFEYVNIIRRQISPNAVLGVGELPYKNPNKIDNQIIDISKLIQDTGYEPHYSFDKGIQITIDYFKNILSK